MLSQVEASGQAAAFPGYRGRPAAGARSTRRTTGACTTLGVIDPASYQALLSNLGLTPDPRLCVPSVRR